MAGRPIQFDRAHAVGLAVNEFWRHGFNEVSVKGLCEKMQITRSSFYHSFGSLEALYEEAVEQYLGAGPAKSFNKPGGLSNVEAIHQFFTLLCKLRAADKEHRGCLVINSLAEMHNMKTEQKQRLQGRIESSVRGFKRLLNDAVKEGEIPPEAPVETIALALKTLAIGLNTLSTVVVDEQQLLAVTQLSLEGLGLRVAD